MKATERTAEEEWENVKTKVFKGGVPKYMNDLVMNGFKESESESEKFEKLAAVMIMLKIKFGK